MLTIPGFKKCVSCPLSFSVSNKHQRYLCCLGEAHISANCSICCSFPPRTPEGWELRLKKHLMEKVVKPQSTPGCRPLPVHQPQQVGSTSPRTSSGTEAKSLKPKEKASQDSKGHSHRHTANSFVSKSIPKRRDPSPTSSELGEPVHTSAKVLYLLKSS